MHLLYIYIIPFPFFVGFKDITNIEKINHAIEEVYIYIYIFLKKDNFCYIPRDFADGVKISLPGYQYHCSGLRAPSLLSRKLFLNHSTDSRLWLIMINEKWNFVNMKNESTKNHALAHAHVMWGLSTCHDTSMVRTLKPSQSSVTFPI